MHDFKSMRRRAASCVLVLFAAACGSLFVDLDTVRDAAPTAGNAVPFDAPYDRVTAATLRALQGINVNVVSSKESDDGTTILLSKAMNLTSSGEVGRIIIVRSPEPPTMLRVYWEKRSTMQITGTSQAEFIDALKPRIDAALRSTASQ